MTMHESSTELDGPTGIEQQQMLMPVRRLAESEQGESDEEIRCFELGYN